MVIPWRRLLSREPEFDVDTRRWVVLDVESSGLDPRRDRLLSIAAVAVDVTPTGPSIRIGDSFEAVLRQPTSPASPDSSVRANILLHGIGLGAQALGQDPGEALRAFQSYVDRSPLIAYHSAFDQTLIDRHMRSQLGHHLANPWIDLEHVAAALHRQPRRLALDAWMARYNIRCLARHQAAADTLATAELLLRLWPLLRERSASDWNGFQRIAGEAGFMTGRH